MKFSRFVKGTGKLLLLVLFLVFLSGCSSKNLVSLAGIDKSDVWVSDRFGNKVQVEDSTTLLNALKNAKLVKDPQGVRKETEAEYIITSDGSKVYYDSLGKYLIFVDKNQKKSIYSADLTEALAGIQGLAPNIRWSSDLDAYLSPEFVQLAKVERPSAILFERGTNNILMVSAGSKPSGGYTMTVEGAKVTSPGVLSLTVRVIAPSGEASDVVTYPHLEVELPGEMDVEVNLVKSTDTGDKVERVGVARASEDQNIVVLWPERGALLTERVTLYGFAKAPISTFSVEIEDGHDILGKKTVDVAQRADGWNFFEFQMNLSAPTSPHGTIICVRADEDGNRVEEVLVPISFGGK